MTQREFPDRDNLFQYIPAPENFDIVKMGNNGDITSDTCNAAKKARRQFYKSVTDVGGIVH